MQNVKKLTTNGIIGPGKEIDSPLNFDNWGSLEFIEQFFKMISHRNDGLGNASQFGEDIADGAMRAAEKWGRLEQDLSTGDLMYPYWGYPFHYDPRVQFEWGYGTILGDRDINEHCIMRLYTYTDPKYFADSPTPPTIEELVQIITRKMVPFQDDMLMLDYSAENMYSEHMAKLVAWHRYYTRVWKESIQFCDNRWPDFVNSCAPDMIGSTGEAEPRFLTAVTGKDFTFLDGINVGKKIWNLDHAIWTLQGRHRDMVHFAVYTKTLRSGEYVRVNDFEGTVVESGLFVTRIRTGLGEELTISNSLIVGTVTKNYSRAVNGSGFVLDTVVTIGYDAPWRQVEAMLLEAASRTEGVVQDPPSRVHQTALSDFYVEYRLVTYAIPAYPVPRALVLSALHAHIQDVFNEYGVQIMSPHYLGDPSTPKVVPRSAWHAAPARPGDGSSGPK